MLKVMIIGHLGIDVEVKDLNGTLYDCMRVAVNSRDKNGVETTQWVDATMRHTSDKLQPYLVKGACVYVCGELHTRAFSSEKYHTWMVGLSVYVRDFQLISSPYKKDEQPQSDEQKYDGF